MDQAIDSGCRDHGILEDRFPLGKRKIRRDQHVASLITFGQEGKENVHFVPVLVDIADIVDDQSSVAGEPFQHPGQLEVPLGQKQLLDEQPAGREEDLAALAKQ